jgi:hypothetical protein
MSLQVNGRSSNNALKPIVCCPSRAFNGSNVDGTVLLRECSRFCLRWGGSWELDPTIAGVELIDTTCMGVRKEFKGPNAYRLEAIAGTGGARGRPCICQWTTISAMYASADTTDFHSSSRCYSFVNPFDPAAPTTGSDLLAHPSGTFDSRFLVDSNPELAGD